MKTLRLSCLLLFALCPLLSAQAVDPALQAAVDAAVPAQYAGYTSLALITLMMIGRWLKALQNGTGIRGWLSAIWLGTNTPKILIACLCLLSLPSCSYLAPLSAIAIDYGERKQLYTADDAATLREVRNVLTSAKQPRNVTPKN
jgi:hypothetical protein